MNRIILGLIIDQSLIITNKKTHILINKKITNEYFSLYSYEYSYYRSKEPRINDGLWRNCDLYNPYSKPHTITCKRVFNHRILDEWYNINIDDSFQLSYNMIDDIYLYHSHEFLPNKYFFSSGKDHPHGYKELE